MGAMRPIGDIDFYVGKSLQTLGTQQAGCATGDLCGHSKSIKLFSQSLKKGTKFDEVLECQFESELKVHNCRETEEKPRFGYFYEHQPEMGKGVGIFGVLGNSMCIFWFSTKVSLSMNLKSSIELLILDKLWPCIL